MGAPDGRPEGGNLVRMVPSPARADRHDEVAEKAKKKKDKIRSAWIAFVGRILAQFIGAAATVGLGLILARHLHVADRGAPATPAPAPPAAAAPIVPVVPRAAGISIAVLPLANLSGDAQQDYFADSLTEAIITDLAKVRALRVISRTSVMRYKGTSRPLPEIARELGVSAVVEGSIVRVGDRVRVTAQLIDATTDEHLWAESYERDARDVLALQDAVARAIAVEVRRALLDL